MSGVRFSRLLLAAVAGTLVGGYGVWLLSPATAHVTSAPVGVAAGGPAASQLVESRERQPIPGEQAADAMPAGVPPREDASLLSSALQAYARSEIAGGWHEGRSDDVPADVVAELMERFAAMVRSQPRSLGKQAAEGRKLAERKASRFAGDDLIALLQVIQGDEPEAKELVQSERFAELFTPRGGRGGIDGTRLQRGEAVGANSVVAFPAGVFPFPDLGAASRGSDWSFPSDIVVRGAGMDATLLMWDEQTSRGPMQRFAIEDCTVFAGGVTNLGADAPAVLSMRNVRVIGFDTGAGGSAALYLRGGCALAAVSCRFESGFGRSPIGYANLLRGSGPCLARFERCSVERCDLDDAAGANVLFVDCALNDMLSSQPNGPTFQNCRYTTIPAGKENDPDYRRRDLNTLFPDWQRRLPRR